MNKKRIIGILAVICLCIIIATMLYRNSLIKDNRIYEAENTAKKENIARLESTLDVYANSPFYDYKKLGIEATSNIMPLTVSSDKNTLYFMKPLETTSTVKYPLLIKGETTYNVDLYKQDLSSKKSEIIAKNISIICTVKWSPDGSKLAMIGNNNLRLYDTIQNKFLLEDELRKLNITNCSWSPDGSKLFTEQPNLPNGVVININTKVITEAFENKEEAYYKDALNEKYYIMQKQVINSSIPSLSQSIIKLASEDGSYINDISEGLYLDSYKQAILFVDKNNALQYIQNFNQPQNVINVSKEPCYSAQFIYDGNIAYINSALDPETNKFILHVADNKALEIKAIEVSGSNFLLLPDGKSVYINGPKHEKIDLVNGIIESTVDYPIPSDLNNIMNTVNGGIDVIYKFFTQQQNTESNIKKYFTPSLILKGIPFISSGDSLMKSLPSSILKSNWKVSILLQKVKITEDQGKAEISIVVKGTAIWLEQLTGNFDLTLTKNQGKWYINSAVLQK